MTWTTIEEFPSYEISDQYDDSIHSYPIRRKKNEKLIRVSVDTKGYGRVYLDGKYRKVHRVIAKQFIENEDFEHKNDIDHIDTNSLNNSISNLRWCSRRDNERNRKLPGTAFQERSVNQKKNRKKRSEISDLFYAMMDIWKRMKRWNICLLNKSNRRADLSKQ